MLLKKLKSLIRIILRNIFPQLMSYQNDWGNTQRYRKANHMIKKQSNVAVVFMGDSITEQWGDLCPQFFAKNSYVNRGIGGQTTAQMLVRFRQDVIDLKPNMVLILAGTNDIAGNTGPMTIEGIFENLKSMTELAEANDIKVALCSVLPVYNYPWAIVKNPVEKISQLNTLIKEYTQEKGLVYIDYYSALVDENSGMKKPYTTDGVHATILGYEQMMPLAQKAIESV
ncbi:MAG: acylhydrolase [Flavobacteriales bacterium]|nr:acylhydrolase [Flavobacteriales bacterium]